MYVLFDLKWELACFLDRRKASICRNTNSVLLLLHTCTLVLSNPIFCAFVTQDGNVVVVVLVLQYRLPHRYRTWILHAMLGATRMQRFELSMLHTS